MRMKAPVQWNLSRAQGELNFSNLVRPLATTVGGNLMLAGVPRRLVVIRRVLPRNRSRLGASLLSVPRDRVAHGRERK